MVAVVKNFSWYRWLKECSMLVAVVLYFKITAKRLKKLNQNNDNCIIVAYKYQIAHSLPKATQLLSQEMESGKITRMCVLISELHL